MSHALPKSFTVRPASLDDAEAIADVVNACSIEQAGKSQVKGQQIRCGLQIPGLNLETDALVAVGPGGQLVAYALVQDDAPHKLIFAQAQVRPRYRGMGIGAALCQWVQGRARRSISEAPDGARVALL